MRFYTKQHQFYCGIDLHARTMSLCILNQEGEMLVHRNMPAGPEPFLKAGAPYRADVVGCVACLCTWSWLADLCTRAGMPFVLGHALSMKAIPGGKATHAKIDAQTMAVLLRGGLGPQAYVSPAARRATRALRRRRMHLMRKRAELVTHVQQPHCPYTWPEIGQTIAYKAKRAGVAERFPDPAVQKSIEVALALIDSYDQLLRDLELAIVTPAQQHEAHTLSVLQTVPGIGQLLRLVLLDEIQNIARFPRVQDVVSYCRLVQCAKASAGKRSGTSGTKIGNAYLTWAFSEAAVLFLRNTPAGQKALARLETTHGQGKAWTVLAHQLARAAYEMLKRGTAFDMGPFLQGYGSGAGAPAASRGPQGVSLTIVLGKELPPASANAQTPIGPIP